jgi:hypothetical protein
MVNPAGASIGSLVIIGVVVICVVIGIFFIIRIMKKRNKKVS